MSTIPNNFRYHFFPVGQGLFATGCLRRDDEDAPRYYWVYDCGTSSSDDLLGAYGPCQVDKLRGVTSLGRLEAH